MGIFTRYSCVLCLFFWRNLVFGEISVYVAEPSEDEALNPPAFRQERSFPALSLAVSGPEALEDGEHCLELLQDFGQRYASLATCLVSNARPVELCQNCYRGFNYFQEIYANISEEVGPGNMSCYEFLFRSDRLMLLYNLNKSLEDIWQSAECINCLTEDQKSVSNTTLDFIEQLNQSRTCFQKYHRNHSELCVECRTSYKALNYLYSNMSKNKKLCIDVEDAMNVTRHLWSNNFTCSLQREENVPVIVVSSFMLFLPLIFYLSNYLHSEQKKRKLIHPKRVKSSHSLMNIQGKYS